MGRVADMRKSSIYVIFMGLSLLVLTFLLFVHPLSGRDYRKSVLEEKKRLVREMGITDLCLFTEARYTRHLSQADLHSAFQDHPMALEHFPSGSIVRPPVSLWMMPLDY